MQLEPRAASTHLAHQREWLNPFAPHFIIALQLQIAGHHQALPSCRRSTFLFDCLITVARTVNRRRPSIA